MADERSYAMPLTQELIADVLGLSVPHVNRTLRQLRSDGLLTIEGQRVLINDFEGLSSLAGFKRAYLDRLRIPEGLLAEPEPAPFETAEKGPSATRVAAAPG
jgi:DNA-binding transcriptional regulator LsrR (DeoR family)